MSEIDNGNLAEIKDLSVSFMTDAGSIKAIDGISFKIPRRKVIGVVAASWRSRSASWAVRKAGLSAAFVLR